MKKLFLFSILWLVVVSAWANASPPSLEHKEKLSELSQTIQAPAVALSDYSSKLEAHQKLHSYLLSYGEFLVTEIQASRLLTGEHLNRIHQGLSVYLHSTKLLTDEIKLCDIANVKLALMIHLAESFKAIRDVYYSQSLLRKIVKDQQEFEAYGLGLMAVLKDELLSKESAQSLEKLIKSFSIQPNNYFDGLIRDSVSYKLVLENKKLEDYFEANSSLGDRFSSFVSTITNGLSRGFGALIGNIQWRTGYLYENEEFKNKILSELKPLDMVFEKKAFKLTDKTIPGNWGHVAVWLGDEEQLRALGIWNEPELEPFREMISQGKSIFEMRRWGMQFDSIDNFLNLDEIAITRVKSILDRSKTDILKVYQLLFEQMDKGYDFSFDAMATAKVTCTEIIMLSYGQMNWPMDRVLGRYSITPNNMAEIALYDSSPVEFVSYYRAKKLHQIKDLEQDEFAKVLGYRERRGETLGFEKVNRVCRNRRYRHHGAIRMQRQCHDEFETREYLTPTNY